MGTTTTNYALYKPADDESGVVWGPLINASMDTIDAQLKTIVDSVTAAIAYTDLKYSQATSLIPNSDYFAVDDLGAMVLDQSGYLLITN